MPAKLEVVLRRNLRKALSSGEVDRAREVLSLLQEEDPVSLETRGLEVEVLVRGGQLEEASALSRQLCELYPESPRVCFLAGELAYKRKDYASALAHLRESCRLHPHWRSQHLLACALTQAGHFSEAERQLLELVRAHPHCGRDLAWLYERMAQPERARRALEAYLTRYPDDRLAKAQHLRLGARALEPEALVEEVEGLLEIDEEVPEALLPGYCEALVKLGRQAELRSFLADRREGLEPRLAVRIGWACYKLQVYDLALDLFLRGFLRERRNFKFLTALEAAAARCQRLEELFPLYEAHAPEERSLYGRLVTLKRRAGK